MAAAGGIADERETALDHSVGDQRVARGREGLLAVDGSSHRRAKRLG